MVPALIATLGSFLIFLAVVGAASLIAKSHHYYEDPDEDAQHQHHGSHGEVVDVKATLHSQHS